MKKEIIEIIGSSNYVDIKKFKQSYDMFGYVGNSPVEINYFKEIDKIISEQEEQENNKSLIKLIELNIARDIIQEYLQTVRYEGKYDVETCKKNIDSIVRWINKAPYRIKNLSGEIESLKLNIKKLN